MEETARNKHAILEKDEAVEEAIWAGICAKRAHDEVARKMPGVKEAKREEFKRAVQARIAQVKRKDYRKDLGTSHVEKRLPVSRIDYS
jgi:hypothetical protein